MAKPTKSDNIKSAVAILITSGVPQNFNEDGSPRLEAIQDLVGKDVTAQDVAAAAPEGGFKRPVEAAPTPPPVPTTITVDVPASYVAPVPQHPAADAADDARPEGTGTGDKALDAAIAGRDLENPSTPDPRDTIRAANAVIESIDPEIKAVARAAEAAGARLKELQAAKNKQLDIVEGAKALVSQSDAVKAVQKQSQRNRTELKQRTELAAVALKASGFVPAASALDHAMQNRKRTPESVTNMAKYTHQQAAQRLEGRVGQR